MRRPEEEEPNVYITSTTNTTMIAFSHRLSLSGHNCMRTHRVIDRLDRLEGVLSSNVYSD